MRAPSATSKTTPPFELLHSGRIRFVAPHVLGAMLFWLAYAFGPSMMYSTRLSWADIGQVMISTQIWVALGLFFLPFDLEANSAGKVATTSLFVVPTTLGWGIVGMAYGQSLPIAFAWVLGLLLCFVILAVVCGSVVGFICAGLAEKFILHPLAWLVNVQVIGIDQAAKGEFIKPSRPQNSSPDSLQQSGSRQNTQKSDRPAQLMEKSVEGDAIGFDIARPSLRLDQLAGMNDLKAELLPVLALYRGYAKCKGVVADRNGILLSGPPGNGKTTFAEAIAGELGLPLIKVSGKDIQSKWVNESAKYIKALFAQAAQEPCVVFFDEFETLAASRANATMNAEDKKVVTALLPAIDVARKQRIVLIAATNYVDQVDGAVMRDGRFDFRIEIPYPDLEARTGILQGMLATYKVRSSQEVIGYVAKLWERRSVAFIESAVKRVRDNGVSRAGASVEDFKRASREASRRASAIPKEGAKLSELALPKSVRDEADSLLYRVKNWEKIAERGGEAPSGVLLYGPPGTGKTNFVRAFARELGDTHVFEVNATDVIQDPRKFRETVELAANHRPAIVFIDEADELLRERVASNNAGATNEILKSMDGMMGKVPEVLFMAATNNAEFMDAAALRGGRFAEKIYMGLLEGRDLVCFLEKEFATKSNVPFAADISPAALAERLGPIAPANALSVLRKAITYSFTADGDYRQVRMIEIEKAIESSSI